MCDVKTEEEGDGVAGRPSKHPLKVSALPVSVYVQLCARDVQSWYCDNLLGDEEKDCKKLKQKTVT